MKKEVGDYIQDIVEAMNKAIEFVEDMSYEVFFRTKKLFLQ